MTAVQLIQITDLHIYTDPEKRAGGRDTLATLKTVVDRVRAWTPDLVLATGDLVDDGNPVAYGRLRPVLHDLERPVAAIPGNHDLIGVMTEHLADETISLAPVHTIGNWSIHMLDSTVEGEHHGHFGQDRLDALDRALQDAEEEHALVVMHHQPAPIGSPLDSMGLDNADALYDVLDRHDSVRGLLWGHIHHIHESERNGVRLIGSPSTCVQFDSRPEMGFTITDEPPACRRLRLDDDGSIDTEVVWVPEALVA
ncbi:MAG: phosphodiesterase [Rhodospirillales bacterium]|nr:phosphodiesterase [Rhodospirillales bacterium]